MKTKEQLKYLTNFIEKDTPGNIATLHYLESIDNSLETQLKNKSKNRELVIDIINGDKSESEWKAPEVNTLGFDEIAIKVNKMNIQGVQFISYEDLLNNVLTYIENFTQGSPNISMSFDITKTGDREQDSRRIASKCQMCSNYIAMSSRKGPATTIIINPITALMNSINIDLFTGHQLIESNLISKDKVIVLRSDLQSLNEDGLILLNSPENGLYFFGETPNNSLENRMVWFYIK